MKKAGEKLGILCCGGYKYSVSFSVSVVIITTNMVGKAGIEPA